MTDDCMMSLGQQTLLPGRDESRPYIFQNLVTIAPIAKDPWAMPPPALDVFYARCTIL